MSTCMRCCFMFTVTVVAPLSMIFFPLSFFPAFGLIFFISLSKSSVSSATGSVALAGTLRCITIDDSFSPFVW